MRICSHLFLPPIVQNFVFCHPEIMSKKIPARHRSALATADGWPAVACEQSGVGGGAKSTGTLKSPMMQLLDAGAQRSLAPQASSYDDKINSTLSTAEVRLLCRVGRGEELVDWRACARPAPAGARSQRCRKLVEVARVARDESVMS